MGGAAFAASVAVAALFIARPDQASIPERAQPVPLVAATNAASTTRANVPEGAPSAPAADQVATSLAVAQVPVAREARIPARRAVRASREGGQLASMRVTAPAAVASGLSADNPSLRPFQQAADQIAVRPWPRDVLSAYPAGGTLAAGFDSRFRQADGESPSFYPFEPRLPSTDPDAAPRQP